ncbi:MAG: hypothetical protein Q7O66_21285, partial [Dehalococcoidia bacterium]|nr:hypothetical protein [Dehalococcoidia bacterium]
RVPVMVDFLVIAILGGLFNLATILISFASPSPLTLTEYSLSIAEQVLMLTFLLMPALVLAGLDLGELSQQTSTWVAGKITSFVPAPLAAGFVVVAAVAKVIMGVAGGFQPGVRVITSFLMILGIVLLSLLLRRRGAPHYEPPFWLLLILACMLFLALLTVIIVDQFLPLLRDVSALTGIGTSMPLIWFITGSVAAGVAICTFFAMRLSKRRAGATTVFLLIYGLWLMLAIGRPQGLFQMIGLDVTGLWPLVTLPEIDVAASISVAVLLLIFLASRSLTKERIAFLATVLLTLTVVSLIYSLYEQETQLNDLVVLVQAALLLIVPITALVSAFRRPMAASRTHRSMVAGLSLAGLAGIATIAILVATSFHILGSLSLPKDTASIIVLAIAVPWDFIMSGSRFTNRDGRRFPRAGRLLFYLGYVSLFCAALVWLKGMRSQELGIFDDSIWPFYGLLTLGLPVIFCSWAFGARDLWKGAPHPSIDDQAITNSESSD